MTDLLRAFSIGLVLALLPGASGAMFRADERRSGTYSPAPKHFAGLQWRFRTGGAVRSSVVVAGGAAYVGSTDGYFYAIDAATGALWWKRALSAPVSATAAFEDGTIFIQSHDGVMHALDARTGRERWRVRFGHDAPLAWGHESGDFYDSSVLVTRSRIYTGAGDGAVYALDARNGSIVWRAKTGGRVRSSPAFDGTTVYAGSFDGCMYALEASSGRVRWRYATEGAALRSGEFGYDRRSIQSSPAVAAGGLYFGSRDGFVYALDAANGKMRWRFDHHISWSNTSPAVDGDVVFAGTSDRRFIQALNARTGVEQWRFTTASNVFASPSVSNGVVYAADWAGMLYAIDERSGKELWHDRITPNLIFSTPAIAAGRLYIGSDDGTVTAYNLANAELRRAVYFDKAHGASTLPSSEQIATYFGKRGYEVLDAAQLATFLRERTRDGVPSVVVFAQDVIPDTVPSEAFQRYLHTGGKVVWLGMPPGMMAYDTRAGGFTLPLTRNKPKELLGISFDRGNFDLLTTHATATGSRWGLRGWWVSNYAADPQSVSQVLATDEQGLAAAYVKSYGGPRGTGFVRIPVVTGDAGYATNLDQIQVAAEYRPR